VFQQHFFGRPTVSSVENNSGEGDLLKGDFWYEWKEAKDLPTAPKCSLKTIVSGVQGQCQLQAWHQQG
jgi:hypothetical protein